MCVNLSIEQGGDFPGGPVVKHPPANAGDVSSIPGLGRFYTLQGNLAHIPQSMCSRACESQLQSPNATTTEACVPRTCALQQDKPSQREAHTPQLESSPPLATTRESSLSATKAQGRQKLILKNHYRAYTKKERSS